MTPKSLFNIILKIFGLYLILNIIQTIPQFYAAIPEGITTIILVLLILLFNGLMAYLLLFKANRIIAILNLDKDFEQEILQLDMHRSTVLTISINVIAGIVLFNTIPLLINQIVSFIQYRQMKNHDYNESFNYTYMVIDVVKIFIALLMIGEQRAIVNFIELRRKK